MRNYQVAGITVAFDARYELSLKQAEPYRVDDSLAPDVVFKVTDDDIAYALKYSGNEPDFAEYAFMRYLFHRESTRFGALVLHSSSVVYEDRAYLFSADSGVGKSTHTRYWLQNFGANGAYILNDDAPALRKFDGVWRACGTPWAGSTFINVNKQVPLQGIGFLERAEVDSVARIGADEAIGLFMKQSMSPLKHRVLEQALDLIVDLLTTVPVYRVGCTNTPNAAQTSYRAMRFPNV